MDKKRIRKKNKNIKCLLICTLLLFVVAVMELLIIVKISKDDKEEVVLNAVQTPVVDFVCGFEEVNSLKVVYSEKNPHAVTFLADMVNVKDVEFLKFYFDNDELGTKVAIIKGKNGQQVKLSMERVKLEESLGLDSLEISRLSSLRDSLIDTILSNFEVMEYFSEDTYEYSEEDYVVTDTPYWKIPFSREWEEYLVVDKTEGVPYKVTFSCKFENKEPVELFTYSFGENVEDEIGQLKEISVGLTIGNEEADKNWSTGEVDIFYTMREEMNYIIDHLVDRRIYTSLDVKI